MRLDETDEIDDKFEVGTVEKHEVIIYSTIWSFLQAYFVAVFGSKVLFELALGLIACICTIVCCLAAVTIRNYIVYVNDAVEGNDAERSALIPITKEDYPLRTEITRERNDVLNFSI